MQTTRRTTGITLIEVLIAIFVVGIGLLGVLAVIPFGAFQVSQENHARHASNMLANAAEEIVIREMANPKSWHVATLSSGGEIVLETVTLQLTVRMRTEDEIWEVWNPDIDGLGLGHEGFEPPKKFVYDTIYHSERVVSPMLNCKKFLWIEPREMVDPPHHIYCIGATFPPIPPNPTPMEWSELMRGQDDLNYTTYDNKRPDFAKQKDKIQGSGKYTWFFTFLPTSEKVVEPQPIPSPVPANLIEMEVNLTSNASPALVFDPPFPRLTPPLSQTFPPIQPRDWVPLSGSHRIWVNSRDFVPVDNGGAWPAAPDQTTPISRRYPIPRAARYYFTDALSSTVDVDVLACYNRVPSKDKQVECNFASSLGGGSFTAATAGSLTTTHLDLLTQTKYVFATWDTADGVDGVWCKVVFVDKSNRQNPKIIVSTVVPGKQDEMLNPVQVTIPSGVLYHKRLEGVPMREE